MAKWVIERIGKKKLSSSDRSSSPGESDRTLPQGSMVVSMTKVDMNQLAPVIRTRVGAKLIHADASDGVMRLWMLENNHEREDWRMLLLARDGMEMDVWWFELTHVATVSDGPDVVHVFERVADNRP